MSPPNAPPLPPLHTHLARRDGCKLGKDGVAECLDIVVVLQQRQVSAMAAARQQQHITDSSHQASSA